MVLDLAERVKEFNNRYLSRLLSLDLSTNQIELDSKGKTLLAGILLDSQYELGENGLWTRFTHQNTKVKAEFFCEPNPRLRNLYLFLNTSLESFQLARGKTWEFKEDRNKIVTAEYFTPGVIGLTIGGVAGAIVGALIGGEGGYEIGLTAGTSGGIALGAIYRKAHLNIAEENFFRRYFLQHMKTGPVAIHNAIEQPEAI